jgi:hypothetical protein
MVSLRSQPSIGGQQLKFTIEKRAFIVETFAFYAAGRFPGRLNALTALERQDAYL